MIVLLSPAKTLDMDPIDWESHTTPRFLEESETLADILQKKKVKQLQDLMSISEKLATLNAQRYQEFGQPFTLGNAKQALWAFKGDVYTGLEADEWTEKEVDFAQDHLRILSGLYGLLRPLDLMQAYRLEMGTKLKNPEGKDLYTFWGDKITALINEDAKAAGTSYVLNLASQEYFKSVHTDKLEPTVIDVDFKEKRNGSYKIISFNAKKARGAMARLIVEGRLTQPEQLQDLEVNGYNFKSDMSTDHKLTFTIE